MAEDIALRKRIHEATITLSEIANLKNGRETKRVTKLINQNAIESDLMAIHLMYKHKPNIDSINQGQSKLKRIAESWRNDKYVWFRTEYQKIFNGAILAFPAWIIFLILSFPLVSLVPSLSSPISVIMIIMPAITITTLIGIWYVDQHEKKLAKKTEVK